MASRGVKTRTQDRRAVPVAVVSPLMPVSTLQNDPTISTATTITQPAGASMVRIQCKTQSISYTLDGTVPTATVGFLLAAGVEKDIFVGDGATLKIIEAAATATVQWQWFR